MASPAKPLPDWDVGAAVYPLSKRIGLFALLAAPVVIVSAAATVLGGGWAWGGLLFFGLWLVVWMISAWRADVRSPMRSLRARPLRHERFENLVSGLAERIGIAVPRLYEVDGPGANAIVFGIRKPAIGVTPALLDHYTRTEQEAVAAHCLLRIRSGRLWLMHVAELLGASGNRFAPRVGDEDDIHTAALTRYPPALISAIENAKPDESAAAPFWFVGHGAAHRHPTQRVAALRDL